MIMTTFSKYSSIIVLLVASRFLSNHWWPGYCLFMDLFVTQLVHMSILNSPVIAAIPTASDNGSEHAANKQTFFVVLATACHPL